MTKIYRQGAIGTLLNKYERTILDLSQTIADFTDSEMTSIVDSKTTDSN